MLNCFRSTFIETVLKESYLHEYVLSSRAVPFPISLRLNRLFSESLTHPDSREAEQLCNDVTDNVSVFDCGRVSECTSAFTELLFSHAAERGVQADSRGAEGAEDLVQVRPATSPLT